MNNKGWTTVDRSSKKNGRPKDSHPINHNAPETSTSTKHSSKTSSNDSFCSSNSYGVTSSGHRYDYSYDTPIDQPEKFSYLRMSKKLAQKIYRARLNKNLSQKQVADSINESVQVVSDYEKGTAIPDKLILLKLKNFLSITD